MPLGIKQIKLREGSKAETNPKGAAMRLLKFEQELYSDTIHGKRKKKIAQITDEVLDEDGDGEADADDDFVPKKKKIILENPKKRPREDNTETGKREGAGKEKSKAIINQSKKKSGSLKAADEEDPVADTPKKKKKKNSKKTNLESVQGLKQKNKTVKQKQIDADVGLSESQIRTPGKKSGIDNGAKRIRRDSSEGSWSVSEIVTPISPSRLDDNVATQSRQDNSEPVVEPQTPTAQSIATPVKTKEIVKQMVKLYGYYFTELLTDQHFSLIFTEVTNFKVDAGHASSAKNPTSDDHEFEKEGENSTSEKYGSAYVGVHASVAAKSGDPLRRQSKTIGWGSETKSYTESGESILQ